MSHQRPPSQDVGSLCLGRTFCATSVIGKTAPMSTYVAAELAAAAEAIDRYKERVATLATSGAGLREDVQAAVFEAERGLLSAHRLLVRAVKVAEKATR